ncbi:TonB-dependent receptor [Comamonas testosteroni]|nr:TonB-dependent receptor [Comamonas testosteroni]WKL18590.1 TonB-dependent receptor [Comamonas testosteroni]WQD45878.1 TonB-dependent receptor [Comamonas testosteroni]
MPDSSPAESLAPHPCSRAGSQAAGVYPHVSPAVHSPCANGNRSRLKPECRPCPRSAASSVAAGACLPATPSTATPTSAASTTRAWTSIPTRPRTCCASGAPTRRPAPGRAVWSSYVRYQINRQWQVSLNFNNMFNKRYYTSIGNLVNSSHYGDPRNVMLTLRGTF